MNRNNNEWIAKVICVGIGCVAAYYVLMWLLPYIVILLALCGAWYLWQEYERRNRH